MGGARGRWGKRGEGGGSEGKVKEVTVGYGHLYICVSAPPSPRHTVTSSSLVSYFDIFRKLKKIHTKIS